MLPIRQLIVCALQFFITSDLTAEGSLGKDVDAASVPILTQFAMSYLVALASCSAKQKEMCREGDSPSCFIMELTDCSIALKVAEVVAMSKIRTKAIDNLIIYMEKI